MQGQFKVSSQLVQDFPIAGSYSTFSYCNRNNRWLMTTTEGYRYQVRDSAMYALDINTAYRCLYTVETSCSFNITDLPWVSLKAFTVIDVQENDKSILSLARNKMKVQLD
jgi:hypothetical protein